MASGSAPVPTSRLNFALVSLNRSSASIVHPPGMSRTGGGFWPASASAGPGHADSASASDALATAPRTEETTRDGGDDAASESTRRLPSTTSTSPTRRRDDDDDDARAAVTRARDVAEGFEPTRGRAETRGSVASIAQ
eukprot:30838-Pelagococcus_subviridis.AAC.13